MNFSVRLRQIIRYAAIAPVLCAFNSCIGDDLSDCPGDLTLRFCYNLNSRYTDLFAEEVSAVDLFLYDREGNYLKTIHRKQSELDGGNTLTLTGELTPGRYTAVAWAGYDNEDYSCTYNCRLEEMRMAVNTTATGQISYKPSHLFHGMVQLEVDNANRNEIMELTRDTHDLEIILKITDASSSAPVAVGDCRVEISGSDAIYSFDNSLPGTQPRVDYILQYSLPATDRLMAECRIERLLKEGDMRIRILDASGQVVNDNAGVPLDRLLADEIMQDPSFQTNTDLDRSEKFTLVYEVVRDPNGNIISAILIMVNNWDVVNQGGHL